MRAPKREEGRGGLIDKQKTQEGERESESEWPSPCAAGHFHAGVSKQQVTARRAHAALAWQLGSGQGEKLLLPRTRDRRGEKGSRRKSRNQAGKPFRWEGQATCPFCQSPLVVSYMQIVYLNKKWQVYLNSVYIMSGLLPELSSLLRNQRVMPDPSLFFAPSAHQSPRPVHLLRTALCPLWVASAFAWTTLPSVPWC